MADKLLTRREAWAFARATAGNAYVYVMWRTDKGRPQPFYVGKGRGPRFSMHTRPGCRSENSMKYSIIQRHAERGLEILYSFPLVTPFDDEAIFCEAELIKLYGRRSTGTGVLANMTDGGEYIMSGFERPKGDDHPHSRAVIIAGERFGSFTQGCRATGLDPKTLKKRIVAGWPGFYYEDEGQRPRKPDGRRAGIQHAFDRAIIVNGSRFSSIKSGAEALGLKRLTLQMRIKRCHPGYAYADPTK